MYHTNVVNTDPVICQRRVLILANEFIDIDEPAIIEGIDDANRCFLLHLQEKLLKDGQIFCYAVASPRLEGDQLAHLINSGSLGCAVIWVPVDKFNETNPFDLTWWRGGSAAIADIKLP